MNTKNKTLDFEHEGRSFLIKVVPEDHGWKIQVFEGDKPATGKSYYVSCENLRDSKGQIEIDIDKLMETARTDFENDCADWKESKCQ